MDHATQVATIETLLDHHARRAPWRHGELHRTPVEAYTSVEWLAREQRMFATVPQFIGLSSDLPAPGTFCTRDDLADPVVLTRDEGGRARAFLNVCRHRGAQVVSDRGAARRLVCPYHAWTYDLSGALRHIPDEGSFPGVDPASCGLAELALAERDGALWLLPTRGGAAELAAHLGPLAAVLADLDLSGFRHWRNERLPLALNWKLVIDTFLEPYHFASLHRDTIGPYFLPNLCTVEAFGPHLREILPRRSILDLRDVPRDEWQLIPHAVIVHVLFPNTVLVMLLDHVETWRVYPDATDPGRCVCELDFYLPVDPGDARKTDDYWEKNWSATINTVLVEDFPAMAGVQRGARSGANRHLTVGTNEAAVALFARAVAATIAAVPRGEP